MKWWQRIRRRISKKYKVVYKRGPSTVAGVFAGIALASWLGFLLLSGYPVFQYLYYRAYPVASEKLSQILQEASKQDLVSAQEQVEPVVNKAELEPDWLPERDVSLPGGQYLSIPKIGVDTVIWEGETENYEEVFRRGVWRIPEMPKPDEGTPVIMAAHRFGYLDWTQEYRRKNSFYNLPKLEEGDEIEIIWNQRRFNYKVVRIVEAEEIDDYSSDLILYTCKFLVSPVRVIVYAERV